MAPVRATPMRTKHRPQRTLATPHAAAQRFATTSVLTGTLAYAAKALGQQASVTHHGIRISPMNMPMSHQCSNWKVFISFIGQAPLPMSSPAQATIRIPSSCWEVIGGC